MANRKRRKIDAKLAARIAKFEDDNRKPGKHEQHRPGSQNLRNN